MPAMRRRTSFAAPVILTVAASCSSQDKPREPRSSFPGPSWQVVMRDMKCRANEPGPNPPAPRAIECPPGMSGNNYITVAQLAPDRCAVVPPGCTEPRCATTPTPCPLPWGQEVVRKLAFVWTIEKRGEDCHAEEEDHDCPPGVDCNPPAPRTFPCPPGVTEEKPLHVAELPDATCVIVPDGCLDTGCATEKIPCPKWK